MIGLLLTCEHARGDVPDGVHLGIEPGQLRTHVAYDRGALDIARRLRERTRAPLHAGRFSRLVVDLNRRDHNPAVIVDETHGLAVPGNGALDEAARQARLDAWHRPWREAVRSSAVVLAEEGCLHLSLHSFDPAVDPDARDFDVGVLFDPARAPETQHARALRDALVEAGFDTRLNEPFLGTPEGTTSWLREQLAPERYSGIELEASYRWVDDDARVATYVHAICHALPGR